MDQGIEKKALRAQLLKRRQAIAPHLMAAKSEQIVQHLLAWPRFQDSQVVYAYRSFRNEICLNRLYESTEKFWGFPRCVGREMVWHQWNPRQQDEFAISRYGIEEPHPHWPSLGQPDLILLPTVACDRQGYRLGYGGGFYDRMLGQMGDRPSVFTLGIALEEFICESLPHDDWDQPLDGICTELDIRKI